MSGQYAKETTVSVEKTRGEIERTLRRYGAHEFAYASRATSATIGFRIKTKAGEAAVKITLPLPDREQFRRTPSRGFRRTDAETDAAWEQECRSAWRSLGLVIKAKLEAVQMRISTIEREFLADLWCPASGSTVYEALEAGELGAALTGQGSMPPLLTAGRAS